MASDHFICGVNRSVNKNKKLKKNKNGVNRSVNMN